MKRWVTFQTKIAKKRGIQKRGSEDKKSWQTWKTKCKRKEIIWTFRTMCTAKEQLALVVEKKSRERRREEIGIVASLDRWVADLMTEDWILLHIKVFNLEQTVDRYCLSVRLGDDLITVVQYGWQWLMGLITGSASFLLLHFYRTGT